MEKEEKKITSTFQLEKKKASFVGKYNNLRWAALFKQGRPRSDTAEKNDKELRCPNISLSVDVSKNGGRSSREYTLMCLKMVGGVVESRLWCV